MIVSIKQYVVILECLMRFFIKLPIYQLNSSGFDQQDISYYIKPTTILFQIKPYPHFIKKKLLRQPSKAVQKALQITYTNI